jgi:HK97 gp10 family phage protein
LAEETEIRVSTTFEIKGTRELVAKLKAAQKRIPTKIEQAMWKSVYAIQRDAKLNVTGGNPLHVQSGRLRTSIAADVSTTGGVEGRIGTNVIYGPVHEDGATIRAKAASYMIFEIDGHVVKVPKVVIPRRPWLEPAMDKNRSKISEIFGREMSVAIKDSGLA